MKDWNLRWEINDQKWRHFENRICSNQLIVLNKNKLNIAHIILNKIMPQFSNNYISSKHVILDLVKAEIINMLQLLHIIILEINFYAKVVFKGRYTKFEVERI